VDTIASTSTIYWRTHVISLTEQDLPQDPTALPVSVGFSLAGDAASAAYTSATWITLTNTAISPQYRARVLVSSGQLAVGIYTVYVKITSSPEIPVLPAGQIRVV
jgi:hypothetical protein